ncbi:MAG: Hydrolase [Candidatus Saccharibacteria bacterium]|nr:Hydrolase [Candidatus Saccharibacteria bacterium]
MRGIVIEHHIQRSIIDRLMHHAQLRFSELKPDGMESNIFMYHLKQLIKAGLVAKTNDAYHLAYAGLQYVDGLSSDDLRPRKQPKLIAIMALHTATGQWLLAERLVQPYIGQRMFVSGKQHFGESFAEQAAREIHEKTGVDVALTYRGIANIRIHDGQMALTHVVAHVHQGEVAQILPAPSDRFRYVWHDFSEDQAPLMPGTRELYEQLQKPGLFTIELDV